MLELQNMRSFLKDVDSRLLKDGAPVSEQEWVEQVRAAAYDIEDMLDEYMLHFGRVRFEFGIPTSFLIRSPTCINNLFKRRIFAMMIEDMKRKISDISARRDRYNLRGLDEGTCSPTVESQVTVERQQLTTTNEAYIAEDSHTDGIDENVDILMKWAQSGDPKLATILLVGMGGSGKTTVARKVYHKLMRNGASAAKKIYRRLMGDSATITQFNCFAWVPVTQSFNAKDVLQRLWIDLGIDGLAMERDVTSLGEAIRQHLHSRRYVIVLDDVWSSDVLNTVGFAFPKHDHQCRLIVTSRLENVAYGSIEVETFSPTKIHRVKPLKPEDSMKLFSRNAFREDQERRCPEHLQETCEKLVDRCNGLPLALVCLGAVISRRERTQLEWTGFYDRLSWELEVNPGLGRVRAIFSLSFDELPIHLKACFLYCGIFPKNHLIKASKLIRLWVSEGLVEEKDGTTLEQVGKQYIEELTQRSLLLVVEKNDKGRVKSCQMHELLRELMMPMSKRQGLSRIIHESGNGSQDHVSRNERSRSLSLMGSTDKIIKEICLRDPKKARRVRSLLMFDSPRIPSLLHKFMLLRVLDLQGVFIEELPHSIGHLYHLRYLNLRNTNLKRIPRSLGKLHNLQALDIRDNQIERIPNLSKVKKLRYVSAYSHFIHPYTISQFSGCDFPRHICKSECLQKLSGINATNKIIETIGNLTQLKTLGLFKVKQEHGEKLCKSIETMKDLLCLGISADSEGELRLELLNTPPPHLEDIWLFGRIERFPKWVKGVINLRRLGLYFSKLRDSPTPYLQELPNLEWFKLYDAYDGRKLKFQANNFPKLKTLTIVKLLKLRSIIVEEEALPQLQTLSICGCPELKRIPDHHRLTNLKKLDLVDMPHYTVTSVPGQGEDQHFGAKLHLYKGSGDKFNKL
ncbi:disease resistance protein RPM1-like [Nymphaea colorata]|uniref:disease resistance protein RPM1-like n=1 Tax=Nymphaea colorata TaxID=210225 RepID=UPI00214E7CF2|nr:disease resistance protein RPM1-like [Nymphaea colorata]